MVYQMSKYSGKTAVSTGGSSVKLTEQSSKMFDLQNAISKYIYNLVWTPVWKYVHFKAWRSDEAPVLDFAY